MSVDVAVVGSLNHDLTVLAPRHPVPGETILGSGHFTGAGGKGANQAVAAARLGASVAMIGRVGDDPEGESLRASLVAAGVEVDAVDTLPDVPTGLAVITVDPSGQNAIVVSPGANGRIDASFVNAYREVVAAARVCLAQLEIPTEAVSEAARLASGSFILNAAPARDLPRELLERVDVLVVNRSELIHITGSDDIETIADVDGPARVVVTLGDAGAAFTDEGTTFRCPAPDVAVVDTTGAGDAFSGALAAAIAAGVDFGEAVRRAVAAGSLATTKEGAQASMPDRDELEHLLRETSRPNPL